jgi:hypothetical protein
VLYSVRAQVPNPDTLPVLTGHSLVKPLAPGDILDPKGGDKLFQSIVPDSSTKALSKYTDMVTARAIGEGGWAYWPYRSH